MSTTRTVFEMGVREYARTPVLLALLAFLPAYFVLFFARVVPDRRVPVHVGGAGTFPVELSTITAVLMTPMAAALVGGAAGLFLMQSARSVDGRLAVVGATVPGILAGRAAVLGLGATLASVVSVAVLALTHVPESPGWFLVATLLTGGIYGSVGVLLGLVLNRLAGVYVLLFGPLLDVFLAQSPLTADGHAIAPYMPAHYPMALAYDAAFTATADADPVWGALAYLLALALLAAIAFAHRLSVR